jgi:hypothetical protein
MIKENAKLEVFLSNKTNHDRNDQDDNKDKEDSCLNGYHNDERKRAKRGIHQNYNDDKNNVIIEDNMFNQKELVLESIKKFNTDLDNGIYRLQGMQK